MALETNSTLTKGKSNWRLPPVKLKNWPSKLGKRAGPKWLLKQLKTRGELDWYSFSENEGKREKVDWEVNSTEVRGNFLCIVIEFFGRAFGKFWAGNGKVTRVKHISSRYHEIEILVNGAYQGCHQGERHFVLQSGHRLILYHISWVSLVVLSIHYSGFGIYKHWVTGWVLLSLPPKLSQAITIVADRKVCFLTSFPSAPYLLDFSSLNGEWRNCTTNL